MDLDYSAIENLLVDGAYLIAMLVSFFAALLVYCFTLYPRYYMIKNSGVGKAWTAFIPIVNDIKFFNMAGYTGVHYLLYLIASCIPVVNFFAIIFLCVVYWKVSGNFALGTFGKILSLFLGYWVYWYVALAQKPYLPAQYQNNTTWYQQNQNDANWYQTPQQPNNSEQQQNQNDNWYQQ